MSAASKKKTTNEVKELNQWQDKRVKETALAHAVALVRSGSYDPKNIVKDAQVFYNFLKSK